MLLAPSPASASLSNLGLVASNNQVNATGVTITISFQVGAVDKSIGVVIPTISGVTTGGSSIQTSADGTTFAAPTMAGTDPIVAIGGNKVVFNLNAGLAVGNWVTVTMTGITNPSSLGGITATVGGTTVNLSAAALAALGDAAVAALLTDVANVTYTIVAMVTNGISSAVGVAPTLGFTPASASHSWALDPVSTATSTAQTETLTVNTNASSYQIQALVSGNLVRAGTDGSNAKDRIEYDGAASAPHFGYRVTPPAGDPGSAGVSTSLERPFSTSPTNLVSGLSLTGLTNSEVTTITYDVLIDYTKAPGNYLGTVTFRVIPTY